jgi:hypothetical protein
MAHSLKNIKRPKGISDAELAAQIVMCPVLEYMVKEKVPLTRETCLDLAWPDRTTEDEKDAEFETQLPPMFRKRGWSRTVLD